MITCITFCIKFWAYSFGIYYFERFSNASTPSTWTASSLNISILEDKGNIFIVIMSIISALGMKTSALNNFLNSFSKF